MSKKRALKPYSSLPEPYLLVGVAVWIDLLAVAWPYLTESEFLLRAAAYAGLLACAAAHSWYFARRALWSNAPGLVALTAVWTVAVGSFLFGLEWLDGVRWLGVLAFAQVLLGSFVFNHVTLRLTQFASLLVMLFATPHMPLVGGGLAWVAFGLISMFVLAYDRTARKAGPLGYGRGEARRTMQRFATVATVALIASALFFVMPVLRWPQSLRIPTPSAIAVESPEAFSLDGSTDLSAASDVAVMRVTTSPVVDGPLYLRGQVFDTFNGVDWSASGEEERKIYVTGNGYTSLRFDGPEVVPASTRPISQKFQMLVNMHEVVFTAFRPDSVRFADASIESVRIGTSDRTVRIDGDLPANLEYEVNGFQDVFDAASLSKAAFSPSDAVTDRDLFVPFGLSRNVVNLANEVTRGKRSAYEKAVAIETYLRRNFKYSLAHDVGGGQIVDDFLFRVKRGHCSVFASTMAMMARSVGLPTRYVTGFLAQRPQADGGFLVRGSDGHAWVEVYVEGAGWIPFDPTSSRVDENDGTLDRLARNSPAESWAEPPPAGEQGGLYGRGDRPPAGGDPREDYRRDRESRDRDGEIARGDSGDGASEDGSRDSAIGIGESKGRNGDRETGRGVFIGAGESASETDGGVGDGEAARRRNGREEAANGRMRSVTAPDGGTSLPPSRADRRRAPERIANRTETPAVVERDGRKLIAAKAKSDPESDRHFLAWLLAGFGLAGLGAVFFWTTGVRRVADKRRIRAALPLAAPVVGDDRDPRRSIVGLYHAMVAGLGGVGFRRREADTPGEFAATVARRASHIGEPVGEMTELFHVARYGDVGVTEADAGRAKEIWRRIAKSVKRIEPDAE